MSNSKRLVRFIAVLSFLLVTLLGTVVHAQTQALAQVQPRILAHIRNEDRVVVKGTASPLLTGSVDSGRMAGGQHLGQMLLMLSPAPEQEQAAAQLIADLHNSSSPS